MTYKELLKKVMPKETITLEDVTGWHNALRAVVELHTPATKNTFTNNDCICMLPNKKCATIEVIEKELL